MFQNVEIWNRVVRIRELIIRELRGNCADGGQPGR